MVIDNHGNDQIEDEAEAAYDNEKKRKASPTVPAQAATATDVAIQSLMSLRGTASTSALEVAPPSRRNKREASPTVPAPAAAATDENIHSNDLDNQQRRRYEQREMTGQEVFEVSIDNQQLSQEAYAATTAVCGGDPQIVYRHVAVMPSEPHAQQTGGNKQRQRDADPSNAEVRNTPTIANGTLDSAIHSSSRVDDFYDKISCLGACGNCQKHFKSKDFMINNQRGERRCIECTRIALFKVVALTRPDSPFTAGIDHPLMVLNFITEALSGKTRCVFALACQIDCHHSNEDMTETAKFNFKTINCSDLKRYSDFKKEFIHGKCKTMTSSKHRLLTYLDGDNSPKPQFYKDREEISLKMRQAITTESIDIFMRPVEKMFFEETFDMEKYLLSCLPYWAIPENAVAAAIPVIPENADSRYIALFNSENVTPYESQPQIVEGWGWRSRSKNAKEYECDKAKKEEEVRIAGKRIVTTQQQRQSRRRKTTNKTNKSDDTHEEEKPRNTTKNDNKWEASFKQLVAYKQKHQHTMVPSEPPTPLGNWVLWQRQVYKANTMSEYRKQQLNSIDFIWEMRNKPSDTEKQLRIRQKHEKKWNENFNQLVAYKEEHKHTAVPTKHPKWGKLGNWARNQRQNYKHNRLSEDRKEKLDSIGFMQKPLDWGDRFKELVAYKQKHKHIAVPKRHPVLGGWVQTQRKNRKKMSKGRKEKLDSIGFIWDPLEKEWNDMYTQFMAYKEIHKTTKVSRQDNPKLYHWIMYQINSCQDPNRISLLNKIGVQCKNDVMSFSTKPQIVKPISTKTRKRRRKITIDNPDTELSDEHIQGMLQTTDDIVRPMIHPGSIWDKSNENNNTGNTKDYETLVLEERARQDAQDGKPQRKTNGSLSISLTQPFLMDNGPLHPKLQQLWQDNYWKAKGEPCPYKRLGPIDDVENVCRDAKADDDDNYVENLCPDAKADDDDIEDRGLAGEVRDLLYGVYHKILDKVGDENDAFVQEINDLLSEVFVEIRDKVGVDDAFVKEIENLLDEVSGTVDGKFCYNSAPHDNWVFAQEIVDLLDAVLDKVSDAQKDATKAPSAADTSTLASDLKEGDEEEETDVPVPDFGNSEDEESIANKYKRTGDDDDALELNMTNDMVLDSEETAKTAASTSHTVEKSTGTKSDAETVTKATGAGSKAKAKKSLRKGGAMQPKTKTQQSKRKARVLSNSPFDSLCFVGLPKEA